MLVYKLTHGDLTTYNGFRWRRNHKRAVPKKLRSTKLCTNGVIHAYASPELAWFMDPIHGNYGEGALLWEAETAKIVADDGLKIGVHDLRLVRQLTCPIPTVVQRVRFGILCAKQVYRNKSWNHWADRWLSGENRTWVAAEHAAENAAEHVASAAASVAASVAVNAAVNAVASAAASTAVNAAHAAYTAAQRTADPISFTKIAKQAMCAKENHP